MEEPVRRQHLLRIVDGSELVLSEQSQAIVMDGNFEAVHEADTVRMGPILRGADDDANGPRWVDRLPVSPLYVLEGYDLGANGVDQIETVVDSRFHNSI